MLGITVADAVAVSSVALSLLMAWLGLKGGDKAKVNRPPPPETAILGATLVDTHTMREVADALRGVESIMREHLDHQRSAASDRMTELLEEIARKLDPPQQRPPHRHPPRRRSRD